MFRERNELGTVTGIIIILPIYGKEKIQNIGDNLEEKFQTINS